MFEFQHNKFQYSEEAAVGKTTNPQVPANVFKMNENTF